MVIPETSTESARRPRRVVIIVVAALAAAVIAAGAWWLSGGALATQPRSVEELVAVNDDIGPQLATGTACAEVGCVEAWRTDLGVYLGFATTGEAEYWATVLGDEGRRWQNVVLDMRGLELSLEERRRAIDVLFSAHDWS